MCQHKKVIKKGAFNCPVCGGEMPKAENYGGAPSYIYQLADCKSCGTELVSRFNYFSNKEGHSAEFYWAECDSIG